MIDAHPEDGKFSSAVLCHARLTNGSAVMVMWWFVCILLLAILLALSPMLVSVSAAFAFISLLVWRLALLC
jgi:hypothetical protein